VKSTLLAAALLTTFGPIQELSPSISIEIRLFSLDWVSLMGILLGGFHQAAYAGCIDPRGGAQYAFG
jgi:hypothetical protein